MRRSLMDVQRIIHRMLGLPASMEIRWISTETGFSHDRKKVVNATGLTKYLRDLDRGVRVATFCSRISEITGAQVAAQVRLYFAGRPVDGRRSIGSLM